MAWTLNFAFDPNREPADPHGSPYAVDPATGRQILWRGVGAGYVAEPDGAGMAVRGAIVMSGPLAHIWAAADRVCERRAAEAAG